MHDLKRLGKWVAAVVTIATAIGCGVSEMKILCASILVAAFLAYLFLRWKQWQREDEWIRILRDCHFKDKKNDIVLYAENGQDFITIYDVPATARALRLELSRQKKDHEQDRIPQDRA